MILLLLAAALALIYFPAIARTLGRRLSPREWARMTTLALVTGAIGLQVFLLALAAPSILRAGGARDLARVCDRFLGHIPHATPPTGWAAAALVLVSGAGAAFGFRRVRRDLAALEVEPHLGLHLQMEGYDLVILPIEAPIAYSREATPAQVVISTGMLQALSDQQLQLVLAHEVAHLTEGHERTLRLLAVIRASLGWMPGVRASIEATRLALERVADETAAGSSFEKRRHLAAALQRIGPRLASVAAAAFGGPDGLGERIAAMKGELDPLPSAHRTVLTGAVSGLRTFAALGLVVLVAVCT